MRITLSDEARRYIALFEDVTGVAARDCVVDEDRVLFVVAPEDMGRAIGPEGDTVAALSDRVGRDVELIEDADTPEAFVANALSPAAVYEVRVEDGDGRVAYADVDEDDKGVAIGAGGRNVEAARLLAERHFGLDDVRIE